MVRDQINKSQKNEDQENKIPTPYINLQSDFGFKRAFGTKRFRKALLLFLDTVFGDEIQITDVKFHNKEIIPNREEGRRIVYDVYCTMKVAPGASILKPYHIKKKDKSKEVKHHFILEMQNIYEPPFEDRMLYYLSKIISEQGEKGWNYDLDPVILISVTDFNMPRLTPKLVQDFGITERTTGEILTKKFRMLFLSLKEVPEKWEDCKNEVQRLLYLIKNMDKMDKDSIPYKEGGYDDLFEAAESADIVGEDVVLYSQSLQRLRSYQAGLEFAAEENWNKGMEKGMEKKSEMIAKSLIKMNQTDEFISQATELSLEKVRSLRKLTSEQEN